MYAFWYKHGKPIHGRSWNNGGVIECSFPYNKAALKTKEQLEGHIQVLTYKGDHNDLGFWYNWIKYSDRFDNAEKTRKMSVVEIRSLFCGTIGSSTFRIMFVTSTMNGNPSKRLRCSDKKNGIQCMWMSVTSLQPLPLMARNTCWLDRPFTQLWYSAAYNFCFNSSTLREYSAEEFERNTWRTTRRARKRYYVGKQKEKLCRETAQHYWAGRIATDCPCIRWNTVGVLNGCCRAFT